MSKRALVLLVAGLVLGIIFAGQAEAQAVVKQNPISVNVIASPSVSSPLHSGTSDGNGLPRVPHIRISDFLYGCPAQAYWMESTRHRGQVYGFVRTGYGAKSATSGGCERAQQSEQAGLATLGSLSGSFSLFSPPGIILRL